MTYNIIHPHDLITRIVILGILLVSTTNHETYFARIWRMSVTLMFEIEVGSQYIYVHTQAYPLNNFNQSIIKNNASCRTFCLRVMIQEKHTLQNTIC